MRNKTEKYMNIINPVYKRYKEKEEKIYSGRKGFVGTKC